ncbi:DUF4197 domain-containing protein [Pseudomonas sp. F1_0610]|uniref:DUF4197 domain-containing protein n=1 Tax=Pseudomonas sp. F1_0610 TaxID=3114284 RepID=UPI0039C149BA
MKKILFALTCVFATQTALALSLNDISAADASSTVKSLLDQGTKVAVKQLSQPGGFSNNDKLRIELPGNFGKAAKTLKMMGQGKLVDDVEKSLNLAAEKAIPEAQALLTQAVQQMTIKDAKEIWTGPNDSATRYLERTSRSQLRERLMPIVSQTTKDVGAIQQYKALTEQAANFGIKTKQSSVESYVADKTLDGLFSVIAEQEAYVRKNPKEAANKTLGVLLESLKK